jgi:hypothetical protein
MLAGMEAAPGGKVLYPEQQDEIDFWTAITKGAYP